MYLLVESCMHLFLIYMRCVYSETAIKYKKNSKYDGKGASHSMTKGEITKRNEMARTKLVLLRDETERMAKILDNISCAYW